MGVRILLVDEDPLILDTLRQMLEAVAPDAIVVASNSPTAVLSELARPFGGPTALVTEFYLPRGEHGDMLIEVARMHGYVLPRAAIISRRGREGTSKIAGIEVREIGKPPHLSELRELVDWLFEPVAVPA